MSMKKFNGKGFTIIEVVLVLAIAGLIFLMVFIALPALQRSQRDSERKTESSKIISSITSFNSNNKSGTLTSALLAPYVDGTDSNPSGIVTLPSGRTVTISNPASGSAASSAAAAATSVNYVIVNGFKCDSTGTTTATTLTPRQYSVFIKLENGDASYCQNN